MTDVNLVVWLLERRANDRKQDLSGNTALDRAAQFAELRNNYAQRFPLSRSCCSITERR